MSCRGARSADQCSDGGATTSLGSIDSEVSAHGRAVVRCRRHEALRQPLLLRSARRGRIRNRVVRSLRRAPSPRGSLTPVAAPGLCVVRSDFGSHSGIVSWSCAVSSAVVMGQPARIDVHTSHDPPGQAGTRSGADPSGNPRGNRPRSTSKLAGGGGERVEVVLVDDGLQAVDAPLGDREMPARRVGVADGDR